LWPGEVIPLFSHRQINESNCPFIILPVQRQLPILIRNAEIRLGCRCGSMEESLPSKGKLWFDPQA
jgi:hypothetical protein